MPYLVDDFCYSTGQGAEQAYWAKQTLPIMPIPGMSVTITGLSAWETGFYQDLDPTAKYTYLVACDQVGPTGSASAFAFDADAMQLGMAGVMTLWAIGFGVGLIISVIRKLRSAK